MDSVGFHAKVNKYTQIGEYKKIFCIRGQDHPLTVNQCISYLDNFKLSSLFR